MPNALSLKWFKPLSQLTKKATLFKELQTQTWKCLIILVQFTQTVSPFIAVLRYEGPKGLKEFLKCPYFFLKMVLCV